MILGISNWLTKVIINWLTEVKFSGIITSIDPDCFCDGTCSMIVDRKLVIWGRGWSKSPWGKTIGFDWSKIKEEKYIGKKAEVFAYKNNLIESYTLEGNEKYYIKLLD